MCLPFNLQKREGFCQLLQQMKNKHSEQPEPDMITIFIGTWNMGRSGRLPLSPPLGHRFLPPPTAPSNGRGYVGRAHLRPPSTALSGESHPFPETMGTRTEP